VLRIEAGLSTYEKELAKNGEDFRRVFAQRQREQKMMEEMGLSFNTGSKPAQQADDQDDAERDAKNKGKKEPKK
jgi:capsid protein